MSIYHHREPYYDASQGTEEAAALTTNGHADPDTTVTQHSVHEVATNGLSLPYRLHNGPVPPQAPAFVGRESDSPANHAALEDGSHPPRQMQQLEIFADELPPRPSKSGKRTRKATTINTLLCLGGLALANLAAGVPSVLSHILVVLVLKWKDAEAPLALAVSIWHIAISVIYLVALFFSYFSRKARCVETNRVIYTVKRALAPVATIALLPTTALILGLVVVAIRKHDDEKDASPGGDTSPPQ